MHSSFASIHPMISYVFFFLTLIAFMPYQNPRALRILIYIWMPYVSLDPRAFLEFLGLSFVSQNLAIEVVYLDYLKSFMRIIIIIVVIVMISTQVYAPGERCVANKCPTVLQLLWIFLLLLAPLR
jgi:hypothetical protein